MHEFLSLALLSVFKFRLRIMKHLQTHLFSMKMMPLSVLLDIVFVLRILKIFELIAMSDDL